MRRTGLQQAVDRALIDVCRGEQPTLTTRPGAAEELAAGARYHRIAPLVHAALRDVEPDLVEGLKEDRGRALTNHLRTSVVLAEIARCLDGLDWLAFKGPILAEFAHPIPGLRFYNDLDLLVAPGDLRETCGRLDAAGWRIAISEASLLSDELPGEVPLVSRAGVVMDLHWSVVVMRSVRRRFDVTAAALLARRVPVTIGPAQLWALSPGDAVVHVCQHAALIGATKLGHLLDADQLARHVNDWEDVVDRADAWGAGVQVAAVLGRAHRVLGTPIPDDIEARLGLSSVQQRLLAALDRAQPAQSLRRDESWLRLVTRALRPRLAGTLGSVVNRAVRGVLHRVQGTDPKPPLLEPPSQDVVDEYLTRVEAAAA